MPHKSALIALTLISFVTLHADQKEAPRMTRATGSFEVKLVPQTDEGQDAVLGRMTIDKQLHGDLEGTSRGQMLSMMTETKGSGAYVALEKVTAKLNGKSGTFALYHSATMTRGAPNLSITVVPDSGTGELAGISGR